MLQSHQRSFAALHVSKWASVHTGNLVPQPASHDHWPRLLASGRSSCRVPTESRLFTTEPRTQLLGFCHWQPARIACQNLVLLHGLEGSSESRYMHGIAAKAYRAGFNVIRMNQRTCGGTEHLTPTLYNTGLSQDYRAIVQELTHIDGLNHLRFSWRTLHYG